VRKFCSDRYVLNARAHDGERTHADSQRVHLGNAPIHSNQSTICPPRGILQGFEREFSFLLIRIKCMRAQREHTHAASPSRKFETFGKVTHSVCFLEPSGSSFTACASRNCFSPPNHPTTLSLARKVARSERRVLKEENLHCEGRLTYP
jgi:hypothetical protein